MHRSGDYSNGCGTRGVHNREAVPSGSEVNNGSELRG
jgi:hypothetical protein